MDLTKYGINSDNKLLQTALTHTSYANEHHKESYERLEFLGDAVLELVISDYFYKNAHLAEGAMTKKRAMYVCEEALDAYAKDINLKEHIKVGNGLVGMVNKTIVADVFESVIACIYLNNGLAKAREFIYDIVIPKIEANNIYLSDYKSYLQELVQTSKKSLEYVVVREEGPSHDKIFEVEVRIDDMIYGRGVGKSKKDAEQEAAKNAIMKSSGGNK